VAENEVAAEGEPGGDLAADGLFPCLLVGCNDTDLALSSLTLVSDQNGTAVPILFVDEPFFFVGPASGGALVKRH